MTYEEAIAELKTSYCAECPAAIENNTCYENECEIFLSIEALEKQIPKKPTNIYIEGIIKHDWSADEYAKFASCPNCGKEVAYEQKYCMECGQAIDWSEEE